MTAFGFERMRMGTAEIRRILLKNSRLQLGARNDSVVVLSGDS